LSARGEIESALERDRTARTTVLLPAVPPPGLRLSDDRVTRLAVEAASGVEGARERLIDALLPLIETIAAADGRLGALGDLLGDPLSASEYEAVIDAVAGEQLHALLARLTEREREIVRARFGFAGPAETLVEIGQRLGLSAERVRQIEERALAKLRRGC
jgi:RNA polymerase sigma factor (sigma-70 family)